MVRNVPKVIYDFLKRSAKAHGRSLNVEVVAILSDEDNWALRRLQINSVMSELRPVREAVRKKYPHAPDSVELIREMRNER